LSREGVAGLNDQQQPPVAQGFMMMSSG